MGKIVGHLFLVTCFLSGSIAFSVPTIWAQTDFLVHKVIIAKEIENRNPQGIFSPPAYCEKDKNGQAAIPIVQATQTPKVFLWVKVEAAKTGKIRHSWHFQIDGTWTKVSEVDLSIQPSPGWRMWSKKTLYPDKHIGEWMVVLAPSDKPERILCITRFSVQ